MPQANTKVNLTDRYIRSVPPAPPGKREVHWDAAQPLFGLRVTDRGSKSFIVVRRLSGSDKPSYQTLGRFPELTLAEARAKAPEVLRTLATGRTPRQVEEEARQVEEEARRRAEEERKRREAGAFPTVAESFVSEHLPRLRSARGCEAMVRNELIPRWSKPAGEVDRSDVIAMVRDVMRRRGPSAARKAFAQGSRVFSWSLGNDLGGVRYNPCAGVKIGDIIGAIRVGDRDLNPREVRLVWIAAGEMGYPFGTVYRLLLLTACRRNELARARWDEVEGDILTVPAERMKGNLPHVVPLTPLILETLDQVPRFNGPHIFTTTGGRRPVSGFSKAKERLDALLGGSVAPFKVHDFRRTVRTGLSSIEVPEHVAERVLAHIDGGVKRTYNKYAYLEEKRDALQRWEARLREIVGG
jgi:integrase